MKQMNFHGRLTAALAAVALLVGCASVPRQTDSYRPTLPQPDTSAATASGSIYHAARDVRLFEDVKARRIGDVITVVLRESTSASKSATTTADKDQETTVANPTFFGASPQFNLPGLIPLDSNKNNNLEQNLSATRAFKGEADASQSNSLSGAITVTIAYPEPGRRVHPDFRYRAAPGYQP